MGTSHATAAPRSASRSRILLAAILLAVGLAGHVLAAHDMGGYWIAYRDHVLGFFLILAVTGAVIAGLGWRYWRRGRLDTMLVVIGAVQALFGLFIYVRFGMR